MSISSSSIEDEGAKKMKRRSSFAPGRRSLIPNVVSESESDEESVESGDSLTEDKMMTGLIHELIAEHKQEQADWNNYIRKEKKETEDFLNGPGISLEFSPNEEPELLSSKYRDAIAKSAEVAQREREASKELRGRILAAEVKMEKVVETAETLATKRKRQVGEAIERKKEMREREEESGVRGDVETLLMSDDSGIGADCTNNNAAHPKA